MSSELPPDVDLYLLRHTRFPSNNDPNIIVGRQSETGLDDTGLWQAEVLGEALRTLIGMEPFTAHASTAMRAHQTLAVALHVMGRRSVPIIPTPVLQEMDQGEWSGLERTTVYTHARREALADINSKYPALAKAMKAPGGECQNEVEQRVSKWANDLKDTAVAATHTWVIKCFAAWVLGWTQEQTYNSPGIPNGSISLFTRKQGRWHIEYLGKRTT